MPMFGAAVIVLALAISPAAASYPVPDGVVDAEGKVVYFVNDKDEIAAVEIATNKVLWTRDRAANLRAIVGDKLIGWASGPKKLQFHAVVLDAKTGKVLKQSEAIDLEDIAGAQFDLSTRIEKDELTFQWTLTETRPQGGIPQLPFVPETSTGAAIVNLTTGKVREFKPKKPEPEVVPEWIKKLPRHNTSNVYGSWTTPFMLDDIVASPELIGATIDSMMMRLYTYDRKTGKELKSVVLMEGTSLALQRSEDGRHVLVCQGVVPENLKPEERFWFVFDLTTGKKVGKVPMKGRPQPAPTIVGGLALTFETSIANSGTRDSCYIHDSVLQVYDLETGKLKWSRPRVPELHPIPRP